MPFRTVATPTLTKGGFSTPAMAASYHPPNDQTNHIHLGVPTSQGGQIAPPGHVLATFISLKRNGAPAAAGRLAPDPNGVFSLKLMRWTPPWNAETGWVSGWKDTLKNALGEMIQPRAPRRGVVAEIHSYPTAGSGCFVSARSRIIRVTAG